MSANYYLTVLILEAFVAGLISADEARELGRKFKLKGFGS